MSARTLLVTGATGGVGRELLTLARAAYRAFGPYVAQRGDVRQ